MAKSQNGWSANDVNQTTSWAIPGTSRKIRLRKGDAGYILVHLAAWFHENVEPIDVGEFDDWGYAERPIRGSDVTLSNHASGTAMDLNAVKHQLGARNTFTNAQERKIRDHLKLYGGTIRWGGDYSGRPDEMHFEINANAAAVAAIAKKLRTASTPAGEELDMNAAELRKIIDDALDAQDKALWTAKTGTGTALIAKINALTNEVATLKAQVAQLLAK